MTPRRELRAAITCCLLGAMLVLGALSQTWVSIRIPAASPLPSQRLEIRGQSFAGGARVLGLVGLAGVAALAATRRTGRIVVGLLIAAAGAGVVTAVVRVLVDTSATQPRQTSAAETNAFNDAGLGFWPYVAIAGGALLVVAGLLAVVRGRSWAAMSERYDAPAAKAPRESSLWDALDRGEDPTDKPTHTDD